MVFLGSPRIPLNALSMIILLWTRVPPSLTTARTIMETFINQQSQRIQPSNIHAVNVLSETKSLISFLYTKAWLSNNHQNLSRYKCTYFQKTKILYWMTSVSDQCCLACTNTVYKAGTTIDTTELEDDCKSIETQVCRKLPGIILLHIYIYENTHLLCRAWKGKDWIRF